MAQLNPKDLTLNWEVRSSRVGTGGGYTSKVPENFVKIKRVSKDEHGTKYSNKFIHFPKKAMAKYFGDSEEYRVALSFEKDRLIMVFNPPDGVPFFKLSVSGSGKKTDDGGVGPKALVNSVIIDKVWEHFNLDKNVRDYYLKLHYFAEINSMELYVLTPQNYNTMLPIFEDEVKNGVELVPESVS